MTIPCGPLALCSAPPGHMVDDGASKKIKPPAAQSSAEGSHSLRPGRVGRQRYPGSTPLLPFLIGWKSGGFHHPIVTSVKKKGRSAGRRIRSLLAPMPQWVPKGNCLGYSLAGAGQGEKAECSVWHSGQRQPLGTSWNSVPGGAPCWGSPSAGS